MMSRKLARTVAAADIQHRSFTGGTGRRMRKALFKLPDEAGLPLGFLLHA